MRTIAFREALREAMSEEMRRDEKIFLMGEEVAEYNGAYKVSQGMLAEFGPKRVIDTPITELGFAAIGVGAAQNGLKPIVEFMTWNFSVLALDQILNTASKMLAMSGGQLKCPIVFRGPNGSAGQLGAQHSTAFESFLANIPGLKVISPSNGYDAKGLLKQAIRYEEDPVMFMESEVMYGDKGEVPEEETQTRARGSVGGWRIPARIPASTEIVRHLPGSCRIGPGFAAHLRGRSRPHSSSALETNRRRRPHRHPGLGKRPQLLSAAGVEVDHQTRGSSGLEGLFRRIHPPRNERFHRGSTAGSNREDLAPDARQRGHPAMPDPEGAPRLGKVRTGGHAVRLPHLDLVGFEGTPHPEHRWSWGGYAMQAGSCREALSQRTDPVDLYECR